MTKPSEENLEKRKETARQNIEKYPNIKSLFHESWVLSQINCLKFDERKGVCGHGLAWLLSNSIDEKVLKHLEESKMKAMQGDVDAGMMAYLQYLDIYEPLLKLADLEKNLEVLKKEKKIHGTIKKAQNETQFWQTLSEIEVAAHFKRNQLLKELEPKIKGRTPDMLIELEGELIYVEVFTPNMAQELRKSIKTGEAVSLKNRAWEKLCDKIDKLPKGTPSIIVINRAFSEINGIDIENAIVGTSQLWIPKDPTQPPQTARKKDGLAYFKDISHIRAIVLYRRYLDFTKGLATSFEVKPFIRNDEENLSKKQIKTLEKVFQSMILPFQEAGLC